MKQFLNHIKINPKRIFLIDGMGALLSAFFLGIVLVQLQSYIEMPVRVLYFLAGLALMFAAYSLICYAFTPIRWYAYLKVITIINALYCCLTIGLVMYFFDQITALGLAYFICEIIVIFLVVRIEALAIIHAKRNV